MSLDIRIRGPVSILELPDHDNRCDTCKKFMYGDVLLITKDKQQDGLVHVHCAMGFISQEINKLG